MNNKLEKWVTADWKSKIFWGFVETIVFGLVISGFFYLLDSRDADINLENKIVGVDHYNWNVACLLLKSTKELEGSDSIPVYSYDVSVYKENLGFIGRKFGVNSEVAIGENVVSMNVVNQMINLSLEGKIVASETRNKIADLSRNIIDVLAKTDKSLSEIKCQYR